MIARVNLEGKQIGAVFLLAVFLFIHVIKLLHTHEEAILPSDNKTAIENVLTSLDCSICDFHLAKDGEHLSVLVSVPYSQQSSSYFNFYKSKSVPSIGLSYLDRGPPASC